MRTQTWPKAQTIDGAYVEPGMWVWDYNLRLSQVLADPPPTESHGVWWFTTTGGLFDGMRMWRYHPSDRTEAVDPNPGELEWGSPCPACGQPPDYCRGHGPIGDPRGHRILMQHDDGDHSCCVTSPCED